MNHKILIVHEFGEKQLKKLLVLSGLLLASALAHADCQIGTSFYTPQTKAAVMSHGWVFKNAGVVCDKLHQAGAKISVMGMASPVAGRTVAWAVLTVEDRATGIVVEDFSSAEIEVSKGVDADGGTELLSSTINAAANRWVELDSALQALDQKRKQLGIAQAH
ncbi:hypothetical protein DWV00_02345 [Trinickia dinghuensis]|uniref:Uncharacterized protein n=1 Tax=Trinickia dinghuensis TaxID=2291023 RepID=A0A3D8K6V9_9BURK|nr:hypothetical protein DWV00_02345 [Trinickia dinghuensis]